MIEQRPSSLFDRRHESCFAEGMTNALLRPICTLMLAGALVATAAPSFASSLTVHGWDLGEKIELTSGRTVWTAELDITLDGAPEHQAAFCVDLDTHIGTDTYYVRAVLDAHTSPSPADEAPRDLRWAGHVMDSYGFDVDLLTGVGVTRDQAITGVQAAIWEGLYFGDGNDIINVDSLSTGARSVFETIMSSQVAGDGTARVIDLVGYQDQVISGSPVPEPSAAIVFGLGALVMGKGAAKRKFSA